jgi:hypothetical protein
MTRARQAVAALASAVLALLVAPLASAQELSVTPSSWNPGAVLVGQSATQSVTVANTGTGLLTVTSYALGPATTGFAIAGGPATPFDLGAGASVQVQVSFQPTLGGRATGTLDVVSSAGTRSTTLEAVGQAPGVGIAPTFIDFGAVAVGATSLGQVTLTNTGTTSLSVGGIALLATSAAEFGLLPIGNFPTTMPLSIAAGASQVFQVQYLPSRVSEDRGVLELTTSAGVVRIPLVGRGASAHVAASPPALGFGNVAVGGAATLGVSIDNPGPASLLVDSFGLAPGTSPGFSLVSPPPTPFALAPGTSQQVQVRLSPAEVGSHLGILDVSTNSSPDPTVSVSLGGGGVRAEYRLEPTVLDFGHISPGGSSTRAVRVVNSGAADLTVNALSFVSGGSAAFSLVSPPAAPFVVPAGSAQTLQARYAPAEAGSDAGMLRIETSAGPGQVLLVGDAQLELEIRYFPNAPPFRIGAGMYCQGCLQVRLLNGVTAPPGGLPVTATSNDPSRLLVAPQTTPQVAGLASAALTIPAGSSSVNVTILALEGVTGQTSVTATAPNSHPATTSAIEVTTPAVTIMNLGSPQTGGGADAPFQARVGVLNSNGTVNPQRLRPDGPGVTVTLTSGTPTAGTLVTNAGASATRTVQITPGNYDSATTVASGGVAFRPLTAGGSTTVTATVPGFTQATGGAQTVVVDPAVPTLSLSLGTTTRLGAGLEVSGCCTVMSNQPAPAGGLAVTLTSSDAARLLVAPSPIPAGGGSGAITITIPEGATSAPFSLQGMEGGDGAATVTASAGGFASGTSGSVGVEPPVVTLLGLAGSMAAGAADDDFQVRIGLPSVPGGTAFGTAQPLRRGGPGVATATVTSSNGAAGTLRTGGGTGLSRTVEIAAGQSDSPATVAGGGIAFDPDNGVTSSQITTVSASVPGFGATAGASQSVTVSFSTTYTLGIGAVPRVGMGLHCSGCQLVTLQNGAVAPAGGLAVTLTSSDPGRLLVGPYQMPASGGTPTTIVTIPAGSSFVAYGVQGVENATPGMATVTATAADAQSATTAPISVEQAVFTLVGLTSPHTGGGPDQSFQVRVGTLNASGGVDPQRVRRGGGGITVTLTSSNPGAGQLVSLSTASATVSIRIDEHQYDSYTGPMGVAFRPTSAGGTTTVSASIPGFAATSGGTQTVLVNGTGPNLSINLGGVSRLGAGLQAAGCCTVTASAGAPAGGLAVTLTSSNAAGLLVAASPVPPAGGGGSLVLTIPEGATSAPFSLQGMEGGNGTATVTATATGYTAATSAAVSVEPPLVTLATLATSLQATAANDDFQVRIGLPTTAGGTTFGTAQPLRLGGPGALTATVTSSNGAAGTLVTSGGSGLSRTVQIVAGQSESPATVAAGGVAFDPDGAAPDGTATTVAATITGYIASAGASQTVTVTSTPPAATLEVVYYTSVPFRIGAGMQCSGCLQVRLLNGATAPAGGLPVTVTSNDPARLLVAPAAIPASGGGASVTLTIPAGASTVNVSPQGLEGVTGQTTVTVTASGHQPATSQPIQVETPGVTILSLSSPQTGGDPDVPFQVRVGLLNGNGTITQQRLRNGGPGATVTLTSSDASAGTLVTNAGAGTPRTIQIGVNQFDSASTVGGGGVAFRPLAAGGTTTVTATIPGFSAGSGAARTVVVTPAGPALGVSLGTATRVGAGLEAAACCAVTSNQPAPVGGLAVTLTSSDPTRLLVAASPVPPAGGGGSLVVTIPEGATSAPFSLQGMEGASGTATVTAAAPGWASATSASVSVEAPVVGLLGLAGNMAPTAANDEFQARIGLPSTAGGTTFGTAQPLRQGGPGAVTATVTSSNGAAGTLVTSGGSGLSRTVQILAGQSESPATVAAGGIAFDPADGAPGSTSTTMAVSIPGFVASTTASQTVTLTGLSLEIWYWFSGGDFYIGRGLQATASVIVRLANGALAPAGGIPVTLTTNNPDLLLVRDPYPVVGEASILVTIPAGQNSVAFGVQAVESAALATANVLASSPGFATATSGPFHIVQPVITLDGDGDGRLASTFSAADPITFFRVHVGVLNQFGQFHGEKLRECTCLPNPSYTVTATSSNGSVGQLVELDQTGTTVLLPYRQGHRFTPLTYLDFDEHGIAFDPIAPGTTDISVSIPGFVQWNATRTVTVTP